MDPDDLPPPPRASQIAHDRLRRKRERLAAQAKAEADAALQPSSGLTPSTTFASLTTSASGLSSSEYTNPASTSALQLNLPGPLSPLNTVYPGGTSLAPGYLHPGTTSTDLTRQPSAVPSSVGLTPSERRRQKEAAGQAIGIEDEIEWGEEEDTLDRFGEEVQEVAGFPNAGLTLSSPVSRTSSGDTSAGPGFNRNRKTSRWDPHVPREKEEAGGRFQVIKPDGFRYGTMGVDARWKKEKKKEERKEMVGKLFGLGKKKQEEGERKREAWEDELEGKSRGNSGSKEQSLHASHPASSKVSLPSSQSQPIRGILRQPGQPRRIISSTTAPDLSSRSQVDLPRPSPATQTTQLSSISGLPASSYASGSSPAYDLHTPLLDDEPGRENMGYPLPPARTPSGHLPTAKTSAEKRKAEIERSGSGIPMANPGIYSYITNAVEQLSSPTPQPIPPFIPGLGMANMDRRPSLASSGGSVMGVSGPNATQTSLHSATESELFFSSSAPTGRPQIGRAGSSFDTLQATRMQPAATNSSTALPLFTPEQLFPYRNQDSRYPYILPRGLSGMMPYNKVSSSGSLLNLPTGWNPNRRPSDSTVYLTPQRSDGLGRSGRSVSETSLANLSSSAPPASRYVPPEKSNKIMDPLPNTRTGDSPLSERSSEYSFRSLASATRESLGLLYPATEPVPRIRPFPAPPPGVISSSSNIDLAPPISRQQPAQQTPTKSNFFSRSTSALTLSRKPKSQDTIVEHFHSTDPVDPDVAFRIPASDRESRMETFFPYSKSTSRDILRAILPEAPMTLGRIETIKRIQTTAIVRIHPPPPDPTGKKSRPGTAVSLLPPLQPDNRGGNTNGVETIWPAQWKKMILVCTSFTFDGNKDQSGMIKGKHEREGTAGPEQTVAHLHLFDPDPDPSSLFPSSSSSKIRRPKTSDTFGGSSSAFGRGFGGYIPDSERLETDRRALMYGVKVVKGEVVDVGDKRGKVEEGTDLVERRIRRKVVWFGWGLKEGWFVEFKDDAEIEQWTDFIRATLRRMGQERLELSATLISDRMRIAQARRSSLNPPKSGPTRSPEEHIAHHLSLGHSIWDPITVPPGPTAIKWTWEAYEHPILKPLREKDKLETFDQMACGKVGWREWLWPVPPGKEVHKGKKKEKRVEGKRRRRKKIKVRLAERKGAGSKGKQVEKKSSDQSTLSSLAANAILLEGQLDPNSTTPTTHPSPPERPNLQPRQSWSTLRTTHSGRSSLSAYSQYTLQSADSAGSDSTARSAATFGRPATGGNRSRPGTANRQLPPLAGPPPTAPLPPIPTASSPNPSRTHSRATSESTSFSTEKTPMAVSLHMFPTPPSTSPPSAGSATSSRLPPSAFPLPLPPGIHASSPPTVQAYPQPNIRSESLGPRSIQIPLGTPVSISGTGLGGGEAGRSTVSLASTASGTNASTSGSLLGPGARRRRPKAQAIDLAGEIKQIDDAREAEIRAAEAAAADAVEPIDEDRPRAIRFA